MIKSEGVKREHNTHNERDQVWKRKHGGRSRYCGRIALGEHVTDVLENERSHDIFTAISAEKEKWKNTASC